MKKLLQRSPAWRSCSRAPPRPRRHAAQRQLRSDARALQGHQRRLRRALEGRRPATTSPSTSARRLGRAGPRGDRRPGGRRGDAGARLRHRRHRATRRKLLPAELADAPAAQQRRPTPRPSCSWCARATREDPGLGRSGQAGRPGDHAEPEDLRRRALGLSRGLGLCAEGAGRQRGQGQGVRRRALQARAGARHRRARRDHDLRAARHRRRAAVVGERGASGAEGSRRRQVRDRLSVDLDPGRAAGRGGRQERRPPRHAQGRRGLSELPLHQAGAGDRGEELLPPARSGSAGGACAPTSRRSRCSRSTMSSAAGPRRRRRTSPTAACSTRSTSPGNKPWPIVAAPPRSRRCAKPERVARLRPLARLHAVLSVARSCSSRWRRWSSGPGSWAGAASGGDHGSRACCMR